MDVPPSRHSFIGKLTQAQVMVDDIFDLPEVIDLFHSLVEICSIFIVNIFRV